MLSTVCAALAFVQLPIVESRTLLTGPKDAHGTEVLLTERIAAKDGFILVSKSIFPDKNVGYAIFAYDKNGVPIQSRQEGQWGDRWNIFETKYSAKECVQSINGSVTKKSLDAKQFANAPALWFWKTHPKKGATETVKILAQNTIATSTFQYTYEDDEAMEIAGRSVTVHRVRETPLDAAPGVYTIWWYDDQGMGVKRYHKTTQHEYRCELLAWR
jgi:uncharacterized protein YcfL